MIRIYYLLICLFIMADILCQDTTEAYIEFADTEFDFGEIDKTEGIEYYIFQFRNSGGKPLTILDVVSTCGCVIPAWRKMPIPPGETEYIKVHLDPKKLSGEFIKTVKVMSNAQNKEVFLTVTGSVISDSMPSSLEYNIGELSIRSKHLNMGYIYKGEQKSRSIIVGNFTDHDLKLGLYNIPPHMDVFINPVTLKPGAFGRIEVMYYADRTDQWDYVIDRIGLIINDIKDEKNKLTVTANIREKFMDQSQIQTDLVPVITIPENSFVFDTIHDSKIINHEFTIRNDGKADLIIRDVKPSCGCTAVIPEKKILSPGESTVIKVEFNPKGRAGNSNNTVTIICNDPQSYKQLLWIKGFIKN